MFRAHRPILRRVHTAVHTTIGSVSVLLWPCALYVQTTCFEPTGPSSGEFTQLFTQPLVQCLYCSGRVLCMYRAHVSGPQAHPQESSHSCSHNHWFSVCTALAVCSVCIEHMFRVHRPILRRVHTAVHTTIGSVSVLLWPCVLYEHTEHTARTVQTLNQWLCEQLCELYLGWACGSETCRDPAVHK